MLPADLQAVADAIGVGTADPDTSRAFVVFNLTDNTLSGVAIFPASMSWPTGTPLPPVRITDMDSNPIPSALTDLAEGPDRKGREDRRHLTFALRFRVDDVPAQGWRTYLAAYVPEPVPRGAEALAPETPGLTVVETLRHDGPLPSQGTFAETGDAMVY